MTEKVPSPALYLSLVSILLPTREGPPALPVYSLPSLTKDTAQNLDTYQDTRTTWREVTRARATDILTGKALAPWRLAAYLTEYADRLYYTQVRSEVNPRMRFAVLVTMHHMKHKVKLMEP